MKRRHGMKRGNKAQVVKSLSGKLRQSDTVADRPTMGNPGRGTGQRAAKARDKRLERASV